MSRFNRSPFAFQRKHNQASDSEVFLFDEIGFFGIQAEPFIKNLNDIDSDTIELRVNSPGGSVFEGMAIFNAIQRHPARITAHVDGLAASISSVITLAADEVRMAQGAFMMIHNPWSFVIGSAAEMRKEAEVLDKIGDSLVNIYVKKTGADRSEIQQLMDDETWFNAEEAVEIGLADSITEQAAEAAHFNLEIFNNVPR